MFPNTQLTLIARIARGGSDADWQAFMADYWGPLCRFASRIAHVGQQEAEDIAAESFLVIFRSKLLATWGHVRSAKLRTLLCAVLRNIAMNRRRVEEGRKRLLEQLASQRGAKEFIESINAEAPTEDLDLFYEAWARELIAQAVDAVMRYCHQQGKGDYFRALYGRVCEGLSAAQIGQSLSISATTVENYLRATKKRLSEELEQLVREHVARYAPAAAIEDEFQQEWGQLGEYLMRHGGLEQAVLAGYQAFPEDLPSAQKSRSFVAINEQIRSDLSLSTATSRDSEKPSGRELR